MGYVGRTYTIDFAEDHPLHGLEAEVVAPSMGVYLEINRSAVDDGVRLIDHLELERDRFAECLVSWNLDDPRTKEPIPATLEGVTAAPTAELQALIRAWWRETTKVPDPLDGRSTSGGTSPGLSSLPMETSSDPPPS